MRCDNGSESNETASSSNEDAINISFEDIVYSVAEGCIARKGRKTILSEVSGDFKAGQLSVIIGQSGAGKSTLMDILSGHTKPTSGYLYVNGQFRDDRWFRRRSCYIMQDDMLQEMLTVRESLMVAANLKLGQQVSHGQKLIRVDEIILALNLNRSRNTRAYNLSGGEKKRLAIGLELVSDPPVMFLDEPTSGLDSSISEQIVNVLHLLARQERTVIATIHQPSAKLLDKIDKLYAVIAGKCVYAGSTSNLVPYLERNGLKVPGFHNPVDFLMEICVDNVDRLVDSSDNGRDTQWVPELIVNNSEKSVDNFTKSVDELCLTALPPPKANETSKLLLRLKSTYATSSWKQFCVLSKRYFLTTWRDPKSTLALIGVHIAIATVLSILFWNIGIDAQYFNQNLSLLYFCLMFIMYTAFSSVSINFPQELPVARREHFNRWYSTGVYYAAALFSVLPRQAICSLTFSSIVYWTTGQYPEALRFVVFTLTLLLVSVVAMCLGLLNGSIFNTMNGTVFGPFMIMPFMIFSGFFLRYKDAAYYLHWLFEVSFLKHGFVSLLLSIYGYERSKFPCNAEYCHYRDPIHFLKDQGFAAETLTKAMLALLGILSIIITCTFVILKIRLKKKW